jgi:hypothetical protein
MSRGWVTAALHAGLCVAVAAPAVAGNRGSLPRFKARALSGVPKTEQDVLGQPAVLVITPTKHAAVACKAWGDKLQKSLPSNVGLWALLALDIPFLVPHEYAVRKAQEKVPPPLWDRTWLLTGGGMDKKLGVPSEAGEPYVFAVDATGKVVAKARGAVTEEKIDRIAEALEAAKTTVR